MQSQLENKVGAKMKSILTSLSFVLFATAPFYAVTADFRIGIVDTERILRESAPALQVEKKIEKEFESRDLEIKKITKQTKEIQAYLDKESRTLMDADHRSKERELANLNVVLQRLQREYREDFNLRKNEELAGVLMRANKAIKIIAESETYDLVLQEAVYRNPKIDITDKVIQYLATEK
jgi:outer membrane protein